VIVVIGSPVARPTTRGIRAGGLAASVALSAAEVGGSVQLVGRVGEDAAGDEVLLSLAAGNVGHVAVLREASHTTPSARPDRAGAEGPDGPDLGSSVLAGDDDAALDGGGEDTLDGLSLDAADLELALRYLPDYRVVVLAGSLDEGTAATAVSAAAWAGAHLVALLGPDGASRDVPPDATVLERPSSDPDGVFARFVAAYAVALDAGTPAADAFAAASRGGGWAPVAG
jgi:hypothetical protein